MNGSRSNNLRQGEYPSIDALNRTIQGLEARIEGLIAPPARDNRLKSDTDRAVDSLSDIVLRQRALSGHRERNVQDSTLRRDDRSLANEIRARLPHTSAPAQAAAGIKSPDAAMQDIAQALVGLRHELKKDISEGVSREVQQLKSEIRGIKAVAGDQTFAEEMRDDLARLADSINRLGHQATPADAAGLRAEFDDLRVAIDGLAREDSLRHLELRWNGVEQKLHGFNAAALQDDLLSLAYQLDDIKANLGTMASNPAIQSLENRLITLASEIETMGQRMQPNDRAITEQFAGLDLRLDEISRAIAAANRSSAVPALDPNILKSFENKLNQLSQAIELVGPAQPDTTISSRIEDLTARVEELVDSGMAARLDERLDQLSRVMESSLRTEQPNDLSDYLSDISRKIDALDSGSVNNELAKQLGFLARRIDEFGSQSAPAAGDSVSMRRLEGRLDDIAARLDSGPAAPIDHSAFRNLEAQIANLSSLLNAPGSASSAKSAEYDHRIAALEDYMATSDEFIMQAARQAAEAVAEAYKRNPISQSSSTTDVSTITALAEDLRHLEDMTRSNEQRTHRTFEALHDTLVKIAQRLDKMDTPDSPRSRPVVAEPVLQETKVPPSRSVAEEPAPAVRPAMPTVATAVVTPQARSAEAVRDPMELVESAKQDFSRLQAETEFEFAQAAQSVAQEVAPRAEPRTVVQPPPATDAVEVYQHSADDSLLLEPGSGVPDVKKILAKVRAAQGAEGASLGNKLSDSEKADFISAARRAAQAAAAEIDSGSVEAPVRPVIQPQKTKQSLILKNRRALLLSAGFILLGVMTYPMLNTMLRGRPSPDTAAVTQTEAPASPGTAAADSPVVPAAAEPETNAAPAADAPSETPAVAATDVASAEVPAPEAAAAAAAKEATDGEVPLALQPLPQPTAGQNATDAVAPATAVPAPETPAAPAPVAEAPKPATETAAPAVAAPTPAAPAVDVSDSVGPPALVAAARTGDPLALFEIGARYTDGRGVKADMSESAKWYGLASDKGFAPAQYRLANLYEKGTGVERDIVKAKALYEKSADQGNASAMHNLAVLAATGAGGKPDMETAAKWFSKAAEMGVKDSQFNLAILYARGTGVKTDLTESYKWFAIAAIAGDTDAAQKRDEVANAMKPDQLTNAKAKVDLWKKAPVSDAANNPMIPDTWTGKGANTGSIDMKKAITNIQAILNNSGFALGKPDGVMGAKTVAAIKAFQTSVGQKPTGEITDELVKALLARNKS